MVIDALRRARRMQATLKKDMVGQWELSTTERSKTCVVTMKPDATPQGLKLDLEPSCGKALPFTKAIAAWSVKGLDIVRLQDSQGQPVIDFTEVEAGIFEGLRANEGVYLLQNLAAARAQSKSMDSLIGNWSVTRGSGQSICSLTLTNNDAGSDNFQLFPQAALRTTGGRIRPECVAAGARRVADALGVGRDLAFRGRRQCAVASRA